MPGTVREPVGPPHDPPFTTILFEPRVVVRVGVPVGVRDFVRVEVDDGGGGRLPVGVGVRVGVPAEAQPLEVRDAVKVIPERSTKSSVYNCTVTV